MIRNNAHEKRGLINLLQIQQHKSYFKLDLIEVDNINYKSRGKNVAENNKINNKVIK